MQLISSRKMFYSIFKITVDVFLRKGMRNVVKLQTRYINFINYSETKPKNQRAVLF